MTGVYIRHYINSCDEVSEDEVTNLKAGKRTPMHVICHLCFIYMFSVNSTEIP